MNALKLFIFLPARKHFLLAEERQLSGLGSAGNKDLPSLVVTFSLPPVNSLRLLAVAKSDPYTLLKSKQDN